MPAPFPQVPHALIRHPQSPAPDGLALQAGAAFTPAGDLMLRFRLEGGNGRLRIPAAAAPERVEGLWRHTCFEAFVMGADAPAYREFNFSPSGAWQAYAFRAYRAGGPLLAATAPGSVRDGGDPLVLEVRLPATELPPGAHLRLGLSAVIEAADGGLSYWALRHPPGRPDFHHSDCLALELKRP